MSAPAFPLAPWGVNDDGDVADEGGELVAINPRTGAFPSALIAAAPELYEALGDLLCIVRESRGVAGWHLNGELAEWSEFDCVQRAEDVFAKARGETL